VLGGCTRCGVLVCSDDGSGTECTDQGVCEPGNACGLIGIGKWDDGVTDCNSCSLLETPTCTASCQPGCAPIVR